MKKLLVLMNIVLLTSSFVLAQDAKVVVKPDSMGTKDGSVDVADVMRTCKEGQKLSKDLEAKREQLSASLKRDEEAFMKEVESVKARAANMTKAEQEAEQQRLMKMERDLKNKVEEAELELKAEMQKIMEALGKEIEAAAREVALKEGLDTLTDVRSGQRIYVSDKVIYNEELVKEMDKNYNAKMAKLNTAKKPEAVK